MEYLTTLYGSDPSVPVAKSAAALVDLLSKRQCVALDVLGRYVHRPFTTSGARALFWARRIHLKRLRLA